MVLISEISDFALNCIVCVAIGMIIAFSYSRTYSNFVYSRHFTHTCVVSVVLCGVLAQIVTESRMGEQTALAFVLVGMLGLIRFRTIVRDSREFTYLFLAIASGASIGSGYHILAFLGCAVSITALYLMNRFGFGTPLNSAFRIKFRVRPDEIDDVETKLRSFSTKFDIVSIKREESGVMTILLEFYMLGQVTATQVIERLDQQALSAITLSISRWDKNPLLGKDED